MEKNYESTKNKILQPRGVGKNTKSAYDMVEIKDVSREEWGSKMYAKGGIYIFAAIICVLSTFGIGEILSTFLPFFVAYPIAFIFVLLIELGEAAFVRTLLKRYVNGQDITGGRYGQVLAFTVLSILMGAFSFYIVILKTDKTTYQDNSIILAKSNDSINKAYNIKNSLLTSQLRNLETSKMMRQKGLLREEEQILQKGLNAQLIINDSLQKADKATFAALYPIQVKQSNFDTSSKNLGKIIGSILAVIILGFLKIYCHYLDFRLAKRIQIEGNTIIEMYSKEQDIINKIQFEKLKEYYLGIVPHMEGFNQYLTIDDNQILSKAITAQTTQTTPADIMNKNSIPPSHKTVIGFKKQEQSDLMRNTQDTELSNTQDDAMRITHTKTAVGSTINCAYSLCNLSFIKNSYQHRFCSSECKIAWNESETGKKLILKSKK